MLVASWNVNSIRARLERFTAWLAARSPDVVCLQETKVVDEQFPAGVIAAAGYQCAIYGQKTYNGVAILARLPLEDVTRGFGNDALDAAGARLVSARVGGMRVYSAYVPNGQMVGSDAWGTKLRWLAGLRALLETRHGADERVAVCGDFNIAPDERDVHDPEFWRTQVLFHPEARAALRDFGSCGLEDTYRLHHAEGGAYSWWDYRGLAFPKNLGLRIDHIFASRPLAAACVAASIDRDVRKGAGASDHAPVLATFEL